MERGDIVEYVEAPLSLKDMIGSVGVIVHPGEAGTAFVQWMAQLGKLDAQCAFEKEYGGKAHDKRCLKVIGHAQT